MKLKFKKNFFSAIPHADNVFNDFKAGAKASSGPWLITSVWPVVLAHC